MRPELVLGFGSPGRGEFPRGMEEVETLDGVLSEEQGFETLGLSAGFVELGNPGYRVAECGRVEGGMVSRAFGLFLGVVEREFTWRLSVDGDA